MEIILFALVDIMLGLVWNLTEADDEKAIVPL